MVRSLAIVPAELRLLLGGVTGFRGDVVPVKSVPARIALRRVSSIWHVFQRQLQENLFVRGVCYRLLRRPRHSHTILPVPTVV